MSTKSAKVLSLLGFFFWESSPDMEIWAQGSTAVMIANNGECDIVMNWGSMEEEIHHCQTVKEAARILKENT